MSIYAQRALLPGVMRKVLALVAEGLRTISTIGEGCALLSLAMQNVYGLFVEGLHYIRTPALTTRTTAGSNVKGFRIICGRFAHYIHYWRRLRTAVAGNAKCLRTICEGFSHYICIPALTTCTTAGSNAKVFFVLVAEGLRTICTIPGEGCALLSLVMRKVYAPFVEGFRTIFASLH